MSIAFETSAVISASPEAIYAAWLSSDGHAAMTGSPASFDGAGVGARFSAWGGFISGRITSVGPGHRFEVDWRTARFDERDADSHVVIELRAEGAATRIAIAHTGLPEHGMAYLEGWETHYFGPMRSHWGG